MKLSLLVLSLVLSVSCMKSRKEYQEAITEVREEQEAEAVKAMEDRRREKEIQREEEAPVNQRSRGSNDVEGMGMDEGITE